MGVGGGGGMSTFIFNYCLSKYKLVLSFIFLQIHKQKVLINNR